MKRTVYLISFLLITIFASDLCAQYSVAREWNEWTLHSIRRDFARPTVHARNLFHISAAMYDAWAVYDDEAETYLLGKEVNGFTCPFDGVTAPADIKAAQEEAISFAVYRMILHRFQFSNDFQELADDLLWHMASLGYDFDNLSTDYVSGGPAELGNYIASQYIDYGFQDNSYEQFLYPNLFYEPVNDPLVMLDPGNPDLDDFNRWQPLTLDVFIDQSGNPIPVNTPDFLSPEWGQVLPFSLQDDDATVYERDGFDYKVYHDPGTPPKTTIDVGGPESDLYKWNFQLVSIWASHLDTTDGVMWDISPASIGNIQSYPTELEDHPEFYDLLEGGDPGIGRDLNPVTGEPYEPNIVPRADYARVLAEFWADGPDSETPPGHWFTILNYVNDHPMFEKRFRGQGEILDDLEWDVKAYFALGGTMHDAAITAWGCKGWYDYIRPVSAIRGMATLGQSSDPALASYHPGGIQLIPGLIELVEADDPLVGDSLHFIGKIKLFTWRGPDYIDDPQVDDAGVGWILADHWWPYQRPSFVTPPFAGYVSGHSTYSRAAAEMMTLLTGDEYFPGGMGEFPALQNEFLVFEEGPSMDVILQWATYRDASDQCSLSRIWGGIHPPADDIPGRLMGMEVGVDAFHYAEEYFYQDVDGDGYLSNVDCDDNNAEVNPGMPETCNGLDDNCDGQADEDLVITTYYLDTDGDGFGDAAISLDTCLTEAPMGYVANSDDCDDTDGAFNPDAPEICNGLDDNCDGQADEGLVITTYYLDTDNDGFGDSATGLDTCLTEAPAGYVTNADDCDDTMQEISPNAVEVCDEIDNDCNGMVDDGLAIFTYYADTDQDGYGDENNFQETCADVAPAGYVNEAGDCDDTNGEVNPDAIEIVDGIDNDCNGVIDDVSSTGEVSQIPHKLFPNPTRGELTIEYAYVGKMTVEVFHMEGRLAQTSVLDFGGSQAVLDLTEMNDGVYLLIFTDENGQRHFVERVAVY